MPDQSLQQSLLFVTLLSSWRSSRLRLTLTDDSGRVTTLLEPRLDDPALPAMLSGPAGICKTLAPTTICLRGRPRVETLPDRPGTSRGPGCRVLHRVSF